MDFSLPFESFQKSLNTKFSKFKLEKPRFKNKCLTGETFTGLTPTQEFIASYYDTTNPDGLFLHHSVGSGKTLTAVNLIKKFEKLGFNTLWVTRTTIKKDLDKALDMVPLKGNLTVLSYKQFSNVGKKKGLIYDKLLKRAKKLQSSTDDPLYKTILIIDEAHKLYTKDLKPQEMHNIKKIEEVIHHSYSKSLKNRVRTVLMSATPITKDPMEMVKLFNLLIVSSKMRFPDNMKEFKRDYLQDDGLFTIDGVVKFQNTIKGILSVYDTSTDPGKFASKTVKNIFVEISQDESEPHKKFCERSLKNCKSNQYIPNSVCIRDNKKCKAIYKENRPFYKKSQASILGKRCGINLTSPLS